MFCFSILWSRILCRSYRNLMIPNISVAHYASQMSGSHDSQIRTWNKRISQMISAGLLNEARQVFDKMAQRNTVTWNAMISGHVRKREMSKARKLFDEMPERDRDAVSWNLMIKGYLSCGGDDGWYVDEGRCMFDRMPMRDIVSWNTMVTGYARLGRMDDALCVFNDMPKRDVVTWNAMISGFLQNGDVDSAIQWFYKMPTHDAASVSALTQGLIQNGRLDEATRILLETGKTIGNVRGDLVHAYNTLIAGYGQNGMVEEARRLFDQIPVYDGRNGGQSKFERNVASWNTLLMCYVKVGDITAARAVFEQMVERDTVSWNTMIGGYTHALDMEQALNLFSQMPNPDTLSWNMMISGYAQIGNLELALNFFKRTPQRNVVSWNSIISGCEHNRNYEGAIKLFLGMKAGGYKPDRHTLSSVLGACAGLAATDLGRQLHQLAIKTLLADVPINNSLVTMYSRCGAIFEARTVFDEMKSKKDVITWNAMIGGYASHGHAAEALELFEVMKKLRVQPTFITFIAILHACAHTGLVEEGYKYFKSMVSDFGIEPRIEHFATVVDILGRQGKLKEAMNLINSMPHKPEKAVWGAMLNACNMHNNVEMARVAAEELMKLEPDSSASYSLLYNMYADMGQWENAAEVRNMLERNNIRKERGSSWVDSMPC